LLMLRDNQRSQRIGRKKVQGPEASALTCAEYRMNSRCASHHNRKKSVKKNLALHDHLRIPGALRPPPINPFQQHR